MRLSKRRKITAIIFEDDEKFANSTDTGSFMQVAENILQYFDISVLIIQEFSFLLTIVGS